LTIPCICAGGKGIISVISNYAPKMFSKCVNFALQGDYKNSIDLHYKLFDYMQVNFIESNPAPVKAIMAELGLIKNNLRLPLVPVSENSKSRIVSLLNKQKVN
jgi:4-hydroxy-tetrahydrodipicolinate synthase